jgi:hypothetical protein
MVFIQYTNPPPYLPSHPQPRENINYQLFCRSTGENITLSQLGILVSHPK